MSSSAHWLVLVSACALGCATPAVVSAPPEVHGLRQELRALRERSAELETRLARLEDRAATQKLSTENSAANEVPSLTVVKLKPRRESAPPMDVRVPVSEPPVEILEELAAAAPPDRGSTVGDLPAEDPAILEVKYQDAVAALRVGNVDGGVVTLEQFAKLHPKHPRADNALYFAGVGRIGLQDYAGAAKVLEDLLSAYPAGDAVQDGMLKLAECRVRLKRNTDARTLYARIVASYPGTAAASQAEQQLSTLSR